MIFGLFCSFAVWAGSACAFFFRVLGPCWHNPECIYVLTTGFFKSFFSCRGRPWHNPHYVDCKKQKAESLKPSRQITQKHKGLSLVTSMLVYSVWKAFLLGSSDFVHRQQLA